MNEFERKVAAMWRAAEKPRLLICVSGGPDSVALLLALKEAVVNKRELKALHCNFHLRGEESDRDRGFVESLCARLGVSLDIRDFDVEAYRREHPCSVETACRELRYSWFREVASSIGAPVRIVTGHHADDNAETLLLNLFRGAGVNGLKGMQPDTGEILRPLLRFSREEILEYLKEKGESYITDSTNLESDYRRNFLRNEVIPLLETRWPGVRKALSNSQSVLRDEARLLERVAEEAISSPVELNFTQVRSVGAPSVVLHRFIAPHGGNSEQVRSMVEAMERQPFQSGKIWNMPDGTRISLERESFQVLPSDKDIVRNPPVFCWGKVKLTEEMRRQMLTDRSNTMAWLPRPPHAYSLRRVAPADRIKPLGMKGSRLLSDIMKDAHMSRAEKEEQWVLTDAATGEIIWAPGLRRSRLELVAEDAEECHIVSFSR